MGRGGRGKSPRRLTKMLKVPNCAHREVGILKSQHRRVKHRHNYLTRIDIWLNMSPGPSAPRPRQDPQPPFLPPS